MATPTADNQTAMVRSLITILRRKQVEARTGLSRSSIYLKLDPKSEYYDKDFPRPIKLGGGAVGWIESEVQRWLELCVSRSRSVHQ